MFAINGFLFCVVGLTLNTVNSICRNLDIEENETLHGFRSNNQAFLATPGTSDFKQPVRYMYPVLCARF